jgi:ATP-binding protein involved in chromosome partitioning
MRVFTDGENRTGVELTSADDAGSQVRANLAAVRAIVALGSARGGVGKSAIAVNLAALLAQSGRKVGIIDADLNSPSVLPMLGVRPPRRPAVTEWIEPIAGPLGLRVLSSDLIPDFELPAASFLDVDDPPNPQLNGRKVVEVGYTKTLRQLFERSRVGALDLLLVDLAPGIEAVGRLTRIIPHAGLVVVTNSPGLSARAARMMGEYATANGMSVIGLIENMAGFSCDGCRSVRPLLPQGAIAPVANELGVPLLQHLSFDPHLAETSDRGVLFVREYSDTPLAKQLLLIAQAVDRTIKSKASIGGREQTEGSL